MITDAQYDQWANARKVAWPNQAGWTAADWKAHVSRVIEAANADESNAELIIRPAPVSCGGPDMQSAFITGSDRDGVPFTAVL